MTFEIGEALIFLFPIISLWGLTSFKKNKKNKKQKGKINENGLGMRKM